MAGDGDGDDPRREFGEEIRRRNHEAIKKDAIAWPEPSMEVLIRTVLPAPSFPLDVLGPWEPWVMHAARSANAVEDYVATPLLSAAASAIGNARRAAVPGFSQPAILWTTSVGDPSSRKTPGAKLLSEAVLDLVEGHMSREYPAQQQEWKMASAAAEAANAAWKERLKEAAKRGREPPPAPDTHVPPEPHQPVLRVSDGTQEGVEKLLAVQPRGALLAPEETAAFFESFKRYQNNTAAFWLKCYDGSRHCKVRAKLEDPLIIERLTVSVCGTIQPERLQPYLVASNDGMIARFLWSWPDRRVRTAWSPEPDVGEAARWLIRLADISMPTATLPLDGDAADLLLACVNRWEEREQSARGLLKSALGKAAGQALRLSLVLQYLWWSASDEGAEPVGIDIAAIEVACRLMNDYFLPMAERVFVEADEPEERRFARELAHHILSTKPRPEVLNVTMIRDRARLVGLNTSDAVKRTVRFLAEAGWLVAAEWTGQSGRPPNNWLVNPKVFTHCH